MKLKHALLVLATAASALAPVAHAQVQLTLIGSTAFRSAVKDRLSTLFDANSIANTANSTTLFYSGTMSNAVPSLGTNQVVIRTAFSGSISGMTDLKNGVYEPCINYDGSATNVLADLAFGEGFPSSATPPISASAFGTNEILGVVPIVFVANNNLVNMGVQNITREQASLLLFDSGPGGIPASFLGATGPNSTNVVYLIGRNTDSGTRITIEHVLGYIGAESLWATNGNGGYIPNPGFSSGGSTANNIAGGAQSIGYVGLSDYSTITNNATALLFEGVAAIPFNVTTGKYPMWAYEHLYSRVGLSPNQQSVREALVAALTNPFYQSTNPLWFNYFVGLTQMTVSRTTDGGQITGNNF